MNNQPGSLMLMRLPLILVLTAYSNSDWINLAGIRYVPGFCPRKLFLFYLELLRERELKELRLQRRTNKKEQGIWLDRSERSNGYIGTDRERAAMNYSI